MSQRGGASSMCILGRAGMGLHEEGGSASPPQVLKHSCSRHLVHYSSVGQEPGTLRCPCHWCRW